jgi:hypothetical protein
VIIQCRCLTPEIRDRLRDAWNWYETRSCL